MIGGETLLAENYSTSYLALVYLGVIAVCAVIAVYSFLLADQGEGAAVQQGLKKEKSGHDGLIFYHGREYNHFGSVDAKFDIS